MGVAVAITWALAGDISRGNDMAKKQGCTIVSMKK